MYRHEPITHLGPSGLLRRNHHVTTRLRGYGRGKEGQKNVLDTPSVPYSDIAPCQAFSKCRPMCVSGGVAIGPWDGCIRRVGRVGPGRVDPRSILRSLTPRSSSPLPLFHMLWACFPSCPPSSIMLVEFPLQTMAVTFSLFFLLLPVQAYIPAIPTNDTAAAIANGTNVTETSQLVIEWYSSE